MVLDIGDVVLPITLLIFGFILGLALERIVLGRLNRIAARTTWGVDDIVLRASRGIFVAGFGVAAVYAATLTIPLSAGALDAIHTILFIISVLAATVFLSRLAADLVRLQAKRSGGALPAASIFTNLSRLLVIVVGVLVVLQSVGISITPILTALGVGGLAVALALQDTLANLFAGLYVLATRQIRPGDYVKLQSGEEGYVADITWRSTTVRMLSNNLIVVPNSKLASAIVTNFDLPDQEMAVLVQVGVSYDSDLEHVERVTIQVGREIMAEVAGGIPEFDPFIRYHTFGDYSINFSVILRGKTFVDQYLLTHEFIKRLHKCFKAEGIEIPFPIRTVQVKEKRGATNEVTRRIE